jgi:hypothetical protein
MKRTQIAATVLVGLGSAACGWFAGELRKVDHLSPAQSIYATWRSHLIAMTDTSGQPRTPGDAMIAGAETFSALSAGLALHHDRLGEQEKAELQRLLPRAKGVPPPRDGRDPAGIIRCLEAAAAGSVDQQCLKTASTGAGPAGGK